MSGAGRAPEVLVVGGGPTGLVTALASRRAGREVVVLEHRRLPLDKPCGEGLMPDAVAVLEGLGVDLSSCGRACRGIAWIDGELRVEGRFPGRPGRGVRRLELHRRLWQAAAAAGVELIDSERLLSVERCGGRWRVASPSGEWRPQWLVGADGLRSHLRRSAGLQGSASPRHRQRFGVRRHFLTAPWSDRVEVYWERGVEAYVTPVGSQEVGVALLFRRGAVQGGEGATFERLLRRFPALSERLAEAETTSSTEPSISA